MSPTELDSPANQLQVLTAQEDADASLVPAQVLSGHRPKSLDEIASAIAERIILIRQYFWEVGALLIQAKQEFTKHGEWRKWLADNVGIPERNAQNYMRVAREYPNPKLISDLGLRAALEVARLPESVRETFIADVHDVGGQQKPVKEMTVKEVKQCVKEEMNSLHLDSPASARPSKKHQWSSDPYHDEDSSRYLGDNGAENLNFDLEEMQACAQRIREFMSNNKLSDNFGDQNTAILFSIHKEISRCLELAEVHN